MKRYIRASLTATDVVRKLYHEMPTELDFIGERAGSNNNVELTFEVNTRFRNEAEDIMKFLAASGLDVRMSRNNRIIITAPEDEDVDEEYGG